MAKLIMMQGLPASGKSTKAKEIVESGEWIRVNRDLLRKMLHFDKWTGKNEDRVVNVEKAIATAALVGGYSVVVDDCNLNPKNRDMWSEVARACNASFQVMAIETPMEECLIRDSKRNVSERVGRSVIVNMALQYALYPKREKGLVLVDLDGTLANLDHRLKYAKGETKNWDTFFSLMDGDTPRKEVWAQMMELKEKGHDILIVSARPETYRSETENWLYKAATSLGYRNFLREDGHSVPWETIIMRRGSDKRDDVDVKTDYFNMYFKDKYPIEAVLDDRPKVIRMWQSNGVPVIDVGAGVEF